jgi:hypothetical protein
MRIRILAFVLGVMAGALLRAAWLPPEVQSSAPSMAASMSSTAGAPAQGRCAAHPVKMPCLFEAGH